MKIKSIFPYILILLTILLMLSSCESVKKEDESSVSRPEGISITLRDKTDKPISNAEVRINDKVYFSNHKGVVEITDTQSIDGKFKILIKKDNYFPVKLTTKKYFFGPDRVIVLQRESEELITFSDSSIADYDEDIPADSVVGPDSEEDLDKETETEGTVSKTVVIKPILSVNETSIQVPVERGNGSLNISNSGNGNLQWDARITSGSGWLNIQGENSGVNDGTLQYSYQTNYSTREREGQLLITASGNASGSPVSIKVTQAGYSNAELLSIANENRRRNNLEFAIRVYNAITDADEEAYFKAQFELANIFYVDKNYEEAIKHFSRALTTNFQAHDSEIYYNRGMAYYSTDQLQYAIMDFEKAIRNYGSFSREQDELLHYLWVQSLVRLARVESNPEKRKNLVDDAKSVVNKYLDNFNGFNRNRTQEILEIREELKY